MGERCKKHEIDYLQQILNHKNVFLLIVLGLWTVCFENFTDIHRFYDVQFKGCMWVFEEEYYIIHDFLLPGFYVAVQFFFTLTFTLLLVSVLLICGIFYYPPDDDRYMTVLLSNGACQLAGGNNSNIGFLLV